MNSRYHIRYLKRQEIDIAAWDRCVTEAPNSLIYGFHYYLDHMTGGQWDALVLEDYEAVMPLTWRRKFGISYLFQPAFTQQTGIFTRRQPDQTLIEAFLASSAQYFRFAEIFLNYDNAYPTLAPHTNFILPLDEPYDTLAARYKNTLVRNLKLAARPTLTYTAGATLDTALTAHHNEYAVRTPHVKTQDYRRFKKLCRYLQDRDQLVLRAVTDAEKHVLATALLLRDRNRLYLIQSATLPAGRKMQANHFLLDQLIREWAGSGLILDFEGSDLPGVARFYARFGGSDQPYYFYRHNKLPWPWKMLKA